MSVQILEKLGFPEFAFITIEVLNKTAGTGDESTTCCATGTRD